MEDKTILQEKNLLNGIFGFDSVDIQWKNALTFHMDTSYVKVKTSPLRDTTAVASMSADIRFGWIDLVKGDKQVQAGDVISVRGLGKIKLEAIGGNTKKGRISIEISRFL